MRHDIHIIPLFLSCPSPLYHPFGMVLEQVQRYLNHWGFSSFKLLWVVVSSVNIQENFQNQIKQEFLNCFLMWLSPAEQIWFKSQNQGECAAVYFYSSLSINSSQRIYRSFQIPARICYSSASNNLNPAIGLIYSAEKQLSTSAEQFQHCSDALIT